MFNDINSSYSRRQGVLWLSVCVWSQTSWAFKQACSTFELRITLTLGRLHNSLSLNLFPLNNDCDYRVGIRI